MRNVIGIWALALGLWGGVACSGSEEAKSAGATVQSVTRPGQSQGDLELLLEGAEFLLGRALTAGERKELASDYSDLLDRDYLCAMTLGRCLEELRVSRMVVRGDANLEIERDRFWSRFYFFAANHMGLKSSSELQEALESNPLPPVGLLLKDNPVLAEDHDQHALVSERHIQRLTESYDFFAEICGATEEEVAAGKKTERAETLQNFYKSEQADKTFFDTAPGRISAQKEAWAQASEERKEAIRVQARPAYKEQGFWALMSILDAFVTEEAHANLIEPSERVVDGERYFLTHGEIRWALDLAVLVHGKELTEEQKSAVSAAMVRDFSQDPEAYNEKLSAIRDGRQQFLDAWGIVIRSDYRNSYGEQLHRAQDPGDVPNLLASFDALPGPVAIGKHPSHVWTPWHGRAVGNFSKLVAWLAEAPMPTEAEQQKLASGALERFRTNPSSQQFLDSYPMYLDEALVGWLLLKPEERQAVRKESKALFDEHGDLARAAAPLARVALAHRQVRVKRSLDAFGSELVNMQIQQMAFSAQLQAHKQVMNTMSETTALMGTTLDDDITYGPGSLTINGEMHQYPYPEAHFLADYAGLAGLSGAFALMMEEQVNLAKQEAAYLETQMNWVLTGALGD